MYVTIIENGFIFAGEDNEQHGVFKCIIGSPTSSGVDEETDIITSTTPYKDTWDFHGKIKSAPLKFPITIALSDGNFIDTVKERELKKWLCKNRYEWLQPCQDDLYNVMYHCIMVNPRKVDDLGANVGMQFDVICDSPWAWTRLKSKTYTSSGTLTFNFYLSTDIDEYVLYPTVIITPTASGTVKIENNTTDKTVEIDNCVTTEVITMDNNSNKLKSSSGRILLDDWNKQFLAMKEGVNSITLTGNFVMELEYRLPVRVGG